MNYSTADLVCAIYQLWVEVKEDRELSSEKLAEFSERYRSIVNDTEGSGVSADIRGFLVLIEARLRQLEALMRLYRYLPRVKQLDVPKDPADASGWSLHALQNFSVFAHQQLVHLQRVPHSVVPENARFDLTAKQYAASSNYASLNRLYSDLRAVRSAEQKEQRGPALVGVTFMELLGVARKRLQGAPGAVQTADFRDLRLERLVGRTIEENEPDPEALVMVLHNWTIGLVHKLSPAKWMTDPLKVRLISDPKRTSSFPARDKILAQTMTQVAFPPGLVDMSLLDILKMYTEPFFSQPLSFEKARFYSAVLAYLMSFASTLVDEYKERFEPIVREASTLKVLADATKPALQQGLKNVAGIGLGLGLWFGGLGAAAAYAGGKVAHLAAQSLLGQPTKSAVPLGQEVVSKSQDLQTKNTAVTEALKKFSQQGAKASEILMKDPNTPKTDEILSNVDNARISAFAFLFLPHLLHAFFSKLEDLIENKTDQLPTPELALMFLPFFALIPEEHTFSQVHLFDPQPLPTAPSNNLLLRHWKARIPTAGVEFLAQNGPPDKSGFVTTSRTDLPQIIYGLGLQLQRFHSDYVFAQTLRHQMAADDSVPSIEPELIEIKLLDALARLHNVDTKPDLLNEFELARQAFSDYATWSTKIHPSSEYFQARPCELLCVRGLDLSIVPGFTSQVRGVRVLFPAQLGSLDVLGRTPDYFDLARKSLNSYLVSVLRENDTFFEMWRALVDLYVARTPVREAFMHECSKGEKRRDLSFD